MPPHCVETSQDKEGALSRIKGIIILRRADGRRRGETSEGGRSKGEKFVASFFFSALPPLSSSSSNFVSRRQPMCGLLFVFYPALWLFLSDPKMPRPRLPLRLYQKCIKIGLWEFVKADRFCFPHILVIGAKRGSHYGQTDLEHPKLLTGSSAL